MTLTVKPQLEKFIQAQVKAGCFSSAEEVVEAGLARLMLDPKPDVLDEQDLKNIQTALDQVDRGEVIDGKEFHAYLRQKYLKNQL